MTSYKVTIEPAVADVLRACTVNGTNIALPRALDRDLYVKVNKVLVTLGGKWDRRAGAHIFTRPVADVLSEALDVGHVVNHDKVAQFFPTPPALAAEIVARAQIGRSDIVLEPSAGDGALAAEIVKYLGTKGRLVLVESDPGRADILRRKAAAWQVRRRGGGEETGCDVSVVEQDFLAYALSPDLLAFNIIVMNPPFSRGQDVAHTQAALRLLAPGGRLVGVVAGQTDDKLDAVTGDKLGSLQGIMNSAKSTPLPAGSFKTSGTTFSTSIVEFNLGDATNPDVARTAPRKRLR